MAADTQRETFVEPAAEAPVLLRGNAGVPRFVAAQIDHVVGLVLFFVAGMSLPQYLGQLAAGCIAFGSYVGYYFLAEWLLGTTIGKSAFHLTVRQLTGERCTAGQIAIRTLLRLVEVNILLLGAVPAGIAVLTTKHHQRLGDLLAGTVVVHEPPQAAPTRKIVIRSNHRSRH